MPTALDTAPAAPAVRGAVLEQRRPRASRYRRFWTRLLTLCVLLFATPGATEVVQELVSYATGSDCCEDGKCDASGGHCCPQTCVHTCCTHPGAVPLPVQQLLPDGWAFRDQEFGWYAARAYASGYRTPPFRPPAV